MDTFSPPVVDEGSNTPNGSRIDTFQRLFQRSSHRSCIQSLSSMVFLHICVCARSVASHPSLSRSLPPSTIAVLRRMPGWLRRCISVWTPIKQTTPAWERWGEETPMPRHLSQYTTLLYSTNNTMSAWLNDRSLPENTLHWTTSIGNHQMLCLYDSRLMIWLLKHFESVTSIGVSHSYFYFLTWFPVNYISHSLLLGYFFLSFSVFPSWHFLKACVGLLKACIHLI